jgi:hypothetical protein
MGTDVQVSACRYCGATDFATRPSEDPRFFARTDCRACGKLHRWEPFPMTAERAAAFVLPYGRHKGRCLADVGSTDEGRRYLWWMVSRDGLSSAMRRALDEFLGRHKP